MFYGPLLKMLMYSSNLLLRKYRQIILFIKTCRIISDESTLMSGFPGPVLNKNMPRAAGVLKWCQELRDRVNSSMDKFKSIENG